MHMMMMSGMSNKLMFVWWIWYQILANILIVCSALSNSSSNVSAIFIFGDSLAEVGNNYYINTIAKPGYPNGIDFPKGTPSGRYTNARTVPDIIEEELGFQYSPPYLAPNTTVDVILNMKGANYASSGSGILNATGAIFGERLCMDIQVSYFSKTRQDIISRIGGEAAHTMLTKALYILLIGANDILFQHSSEIQDTTKYLDDVISKFRSQITSLYKMDARKMVVSGAPRVGCIPYERDVRVFGSGKYCYSPVNELARTYNSRLVGLLQELRTTLPGFTFTYLNNYAILDDILRNYQSYGFENANTACCQVAGVRGGLVPCISISRVCPNRSTYVFWDPYHPTEKANLIAANHALDGGFDYVWPFNLRQFAATS